MRSWLKQSVSATVAPSVDPFAVKQDIGKQVRGNTNQRVFLKCQRRWLVFTPDTLRLVAPDRCPKPDFPSEPKTRYRHRRTGVRPSACIWGYAALQDADRPQR